MSRCSILAVISAFLLVMLGCNASTALSVSNGSISITQGGITNYVIAVGNDASPSEKHAASELQKFLKEISDVEIPIITDDQPLRENEIILGPNEHLHKLGLPIDFAKLGNEGFTIQTYQNYLIIAGGQLRGTMYGVYTFLEDYLGCRWFTSQVSRIPKNPNIRLAPINITQVPPFEYREDFYTDALNADWAARNKMNSSSAKLDEPRGGKIVYYPFAHSFYTILPPEKYFTAHPEYYSEKDGKRFYEGGQLCLTNPEVVKIAIQQVKQWLKEKPEINIVAICQNDCAGWCECPNCKALDEKEGSHSGTIINFVNQIASAIEKEFPDKAIDTFAYQYSRKPPKTIQPRPNVIVRLCSIECCFSHPIASCPENGSFVSDIQGWSKICHRLYVWDYVTDFAHYVMPFPDFAALGPNIRLFANYNVKGIFEEGNYSPGGGGEFAELRAYVLAKLLWNPQYDTAKAISEFMDAYYGKAALAVRRYFDLIHNKVKQDNIHLHIFDPPVSPFLTGDVITEANKCFDEAEKLADSEEILHHVKMARLPVMYVQIATTPADKLEMAQVMKFYQIANDFGITNINEGATLDAFMDALRSPRPFLGIRLSRDADVESGKGVPVGDVIAGSAAEQAGIKPGDTIIEFNGQAVGRPAELTQLIVKCQIGEQVKIKIKRGTETKELTAVLGAAPLY